jgi:SAM-dependent methyltransferase
MTTDKIRVVNSLYLSAANGPVLKFLLHIYLELFGVPLLGKRIRHECARQMAFSKINEKRVLDAGCTIGDFSILMAANGGHVLGVDIADRMQAASNLAENHGLSACFSVQDILAMEFNDHFDGIFALDIFEHIEDDLALALKFCQMLRPGGFLVISVPSPFRKTNDAFEKSIGHVRKGYSMSTLGDLLAGASFQIEDAFYVDPFDLMNTFYSVKNDFIKSVIFPFLYPLAKKKAPSGKTGSILMYKAKKRAMG